MVKNPEKKELIKALSDCGAVSFGNFVLSSGKTSNYYIDIKKASTDPETLSLIAEMMSSIIKDKDIDAIGGVELGGVPIATAVSLRTKLPLTIIRKASKDYGTKSRFIGKVDRGTKIALVEDVTTSGGSVIEAISAIRDTGAIVEAVITVVDRSEGAAEKLKSMDIDLLYLVNADDLTK
ncbi:orotate phosphoribosyltransferase [Methanosalsum zhilinae DSM 4017]|uniref:Orotate phosphoribosyltransferase n=1 Tax=Methanosalsum zhilinae (strain DSM 4017 / NBRC 107636 / OCM 62 / WeN5) TaxID=679901 RepID=F7XQI9_METZD|nr:orotate phosphoribosyltransferase [Methanosalsum zhilinae]AEH60491.1 orotate phosphoribosyltransferase [Methanosalsum zhilinae DSM 4017]